MSRTVTAAISTVVLLLALGCATAGGPGNTYDVRGSYTGRLMVEGEPFDAALTLRGMGSGRVSGTLEVVSPISIEGSVRGRVIDDLLRITITYRNEDGCDGHIEGILDIEPGGAVIDGPVTIADCGSPLAARLSLRK